MSEYLYDRFEFSESYKDEVIEMLRHNTNIEIGGYKIYDGLNNHLMQSPWELSDFIFALKEHEQRTGKKLKKFMEIGFSSGINNTIINKFLNFEEIVAVDNMSSLISTDVFKANLRHKNVTLIVGSSVAESTLKKMKAFSGYDLVFIDGNHNYDFVKQDFYNSLSMLNDGGVIGFHDVDCPDWPGINKFWNELKETGKFNQVEFVKRDFIIQYGIGMLTVK